MCVLGQLSPRWEQPLLEGSQVEQEQSWQGGRLGAARCHLVLLVGVAWFIWQLWDEARGLVLGWIGGFFTFLKRSVTGVLSLTQASDGTRPCWVSRWDRA